MVEDSLGYHKSQLNNNTLVLNSLLNYYYLYNSHYTDGAVIIEDWGYPGTGKCQEGFRNY